MYTIGIDLGGTNIAVGLCDENFNIIDKTSAPTNAHRDAEEITRDMASLASTLFAENVTIFLLRKEILFARKLMRFDDICEQFFTK